MNQISDRLNLIIKQPQRTGIGNHENRGVIAKVFFQMIKVYTPVCLTANSDKIKPGHTSTGWVGAMSTIWRQNLCTTLVLLAEKC